MLNSPTVFPKAPQCQNTHHLQEEVDVWPLVDEEADWVPVDGDPEDEVCRRAGLHRLAQHAVVEGVDQRLVQVQHQGLPLHQA